VIGYQQAAVGNQPSYTDVQNPGFMLTRAEVSCYELELPEGT